MRCFFGHMSCNAVVTKACNSDLKFCNSVATKMSWASYRKTSRDEDLAYSLLGLFDVNMPLLYGEGLEKSFLRLQSKIIKKTSDESIFAWTSNQDVSGMLATHPRLFANVGDLQYPHYWQNRPPVLITNRGVDFSVPKRSLGRASIIENALFPGPHFRKPRIIPVYLNCGYPVGDSCISGLNLACIQLCTQDSRWFRIRCWNNKPREYPQCYEELNKGRAVKMLLQKTEVINVSSPRNRLEIFSCQNEAKIMIKEYEKQTENNKGQNRIKN